MIEFLKSGQEVDIPGTKLKAKVISLCRTGTNDIEYRIVYWVSGERKTTWVSPFEIEKSKPQQTAGFKTYPENNKPLLDK